jgi:putative membrane protein
MATRAVSLDVSAIRRPGPGLWRYYVLRSLLAGPGFPILLLASWLRFRSLRYELDEEGVSMAWGVLFRRRIDLTYARIQDIHLSSNVVERWLGLARIQIQTASGSAKAEMTIEGIGEYERLRDYLYSRMRGVEDAAGVDVPEPSERPAGSGAADEELAAVLLEVAAELRALRLQRADSVAPAGTSDPGDPVP